MILNKKTLLIAAILVLLLSLVASTVDIFGDSSPLITTIMATILFLTFICYQQQSELNGFWHKPSNIFVIGYICLNYQYLVDLVLGFKSREDFYLAHTVNDISILSTIGFSAFCLAYYCTKTSGKSINNVPEYSISVLPLCILQVLFFLAWILTADIVGMMAGATYGVSSETATNSFEGFFYQATEALFVTVILNNYKNVPLSLKEFIKTLPIYSWLIIALYLLIRVMSGDRGPFIYTSLLIFFSFILLSKVKFKFKKIVFALIVASLFINLVGIARRLDNSKSFGERIIDSYTEFFQSSESRFSDKTICPPTEELALSSRCNQVAVNAIKYEQQPYHNGKFMFYNLIQRIPFVPSYLQNDLKIPITELSSDYYLTYEYAGDYRMNQIGTTCIADSYLDWGIMGVVFIMFVIGWIYKKIDYKVCLYGVSTPIMLICVLLVSSHSIYVCRSTIVAQFKHLIPILVFFYANYIISSKKTKQ